MKDNIDKTLEFLEKLYDRLNNFAILMCVITIISIVLISIFNKDIILIVFFINMLIGIIPLAIVLLFSIILVLIECIIYGEN